MVLPGGLESKGRIRDGGREAGMENLTTDGAGSRGLEVEAVPASQEVNDTFRTGGVDPRIGANVGVYAGVETVDEISLMPGSGHGATICPALPSRGRDSVVATGIFRSAVATALGGDASVRRGLVRAGKADEVVAGA